MTTTQSVRTMRAILVAVPAATAALAGCTATPTDEGKAVEERVYVTGSNIARRPNEEGVSPGYAVSGEDIRAGRVEVPKVKTLPNQSSGR